MSTWYLLYYQSIRLAENLQSKAYKQVSKLAEQVKQSINDRVFGLRFFGGGSAKGAVALTQYPLGTKAQRRMRDLVFFCP